MTYLGVLIGIGIMAAMVHLAVNKKSKLSIRIASLAALALMVLTIIICIFLIFTDNSVPVDPSLLIVGAPPAEAREAKNSNFWVMILLMIFLVAVFSVIAFLAMKENKKQTNASAGGTQTSKGFSF